MAAPRPASGTAPGRAAQAIVAEHELDPDWLDEFTTALYRHRQGRELDRILEVWGLNQSEAGRRFGVSRQAVAKWMAGGIPSDRVEAIGNLAAATDLLVHYLKRDRIAAVVRRPVAAAGGPSLLDLFGQARFDEILTTCREMFDFAAVSA